MQPIAQCNTPHQSLQCNTLRYTTVRFDPLCVNATLISQIHTCGAILLPQWQHKCNQIWCIVSFQKVERTRYKHLIAQIRIFLWSTVHFKMTEIYRSNPPMWRIKEQEHFLVPTGCPKIDLVNFIQCKRFIFWLWPIDHWCRLWKLKAEAAFWVQSVFSAPAKALPACANLDVKKVQLFDSITLAITITTTTIRTAITLKITNGHLYAKRGKN